MRRRRRRRCCGDPGTRRSGEARAAGSAGGRVACVSRHDRLGDAAFTRSFNPYTGSVLNGGIMKGAIYEPLVVATVAGGGHIYPWLAQSWKWSNGNKTLTLKISRASSGRTASR